MLSVIMIMLVLSAIFTNVFAVQKDGWQQVDGKWYYYDEGYKYRDGIMMMVKNMYMKTGTSSMAEEI